MMNIWNKPGLMEIPALITQENHYKVHSFSSTHKPCESGTERRGDSFVIICRKEYFRSTTPYLFREFTGCSVGKAALWQAWRGLEGFDPRSDTVLEFQEGPDNPWRIFSLMCWSQDTLEAPRPRQEAENAGNRI